MSLLAFPRLYLRGGASWDPSVANNDPTIYDAENVVLTPPPGVALDGLGEYIRANVTSNGVWNYYGTHDGNFERVRVSGGEIARAQASPSDPLLGAAVEVHGKLVDLDPVAAHTSQLFVDTLTIGDAALGLRADCRRRAHSRWINFARNAAPLPMAGIAGATWQLGLDKADVALAGAEHSPLLAALARALAADDVVGLTLRFNTYRTRYFQNGIQNELAQRPRSPAELLALYQRGENFSNPAYSVLTGVLGLWHRGEPGTAPCGRFLAPADPVATLTRRRGKPSAPVAVQAQLGPAVADFDERTGTLSIDLGATVPERDDELEKLDLGELAVVVDDAGGSTPLATIPFTGYARAAYEARGGIVDLDLSARPDAVAKIAGGRLRLTVAVAAPRNALVERGATVSADDRNVYLDQGQQVVVPLHVSVAGRPAPAGWQVAVAAYDRNLVLVGALPPLPVVDGLAQLVLGARKPSIVMYGFVAVAPGAPLPAPAANLDSTAGDYANVRTLPFDDALERDTPDGALGWEFVAANVLQFYNQLNSVMARAHAPLIAKPLDDRDRMASIAVGVRRAIAAESFESVQHMPVTRELSAGRRRLLERWCDLVLGAPAQPAAPAVALLDQAERTVAAPGAAALAADLAEAVADEAEAPPRLTARTLRVDQRRMLD